MYKSLIIAVSFGLGLSTFTLNANAIELQIPTDTKPSIVHAAEQLKTLTSKERKALTTYLQKKTDRKALESALTSARETHNTRQAFVSPIASRSLDAAPTVPSAKEKCAACCVAFLSKTLPTLGKTALQLIDDVSSDGKVDGMGHDEVPINYMENLADIVNAGIEAIKTQAAK